MSHVKLVHIFAAHRNTRSANTIRISARNDTDGEATLTVTVDDPVPRMTTSAIVDSVNSNFLQKPATYDSVKQGLFTATLVKDPSTYETSFRERVKRQKAARRERS